MQVSLVYVQNNNNGKYTWKYLLYNFSFRQTAILFLYFFNFNPFLLLFSSFFPTFFVLILSYLSRTYYLLFWTFLSGTFFPRWWGGGGGGVHVHPPVTRLYHWLYSHLKIKFKSIFEKDKKTQKAKRLKTTAMFFKI